MNGLAKLTDAEVKLLIKFYSRPKRLMKYKGGWWAYEYAGTARDPAPCRFFENERDAVEWLREFDIVRSIAIRLESTSTEYREVTPLDVWEDFKKRGGWYAEGGPPAGVRRRRSRGSRQHLPRRIPPHEVVARQQAFGAAIEAAKAAAAREAERRAYLDTRGRAKRKEE